MAIIEKSAGIMIKRPLTEVFAYVAAPENFKHWQPFVIAAAITSQKPVAKGTTYSYTFEAMGTIIETQGIITDFRSLKSFDYKATSSPFPLQGGFLFKEVDGFVEVIAHGRAEPGGFFSMAQSIISLLLGRQLNIMLRNLKELLEKKE